MADKKLPSLSTERLQLSALCAQSSIPQMPGIARQDKKASACHQRSCLNVLFKIQQCPCCLVTRMSWNVLRGFLLLAFSNNFIPKHQQEQHPPWVLFLLKVSSSLTLWCSMQIVSLKLCQGCDHFHGFLPNTSTNLLARDIPDLQLIVIIRRPRRWSVSKSTSYSSSNAWM